MKALILAVVGLAVVLTGPGAAKQAIPSFADLLAHPAQLKPALEGVHPRLFFDRTGLDALRDKAKRHPAEWREFLNQSWAVNSEPPAPPATRMEMTLKISGTP